LCTHAGHQIIEDLLTYEMKRELGSSVGAGAAEYSSSSSDEGGEEKGGFSTPMHTWQAIYTASPLNSGEEEDDSEDEYTIKVRYAVIILSRNVLKDVVGSLNQKHLSEPFPLFANMKQHLISISEL